MSFEQKSSSSEIHCCAQNFVEIDPTELPLACPRPQGGSWNGHPRVFLKIEETGEARCPYCGTLYVLKGGPRSKGGH
ncbi:MAG: zinc-finger domain-containing protein [Acidithiobacillus sp.]|nr:zinc-finger domain-containing protein [Acidithiobacillus sp.]